MAATTDRLAAWPARALQAELSGLAAEFPGYDFATEPTWDGISIIARRRGGCARPGLYAVVTGDLDEMRPQPGETSAFQSSIAP